MCQSILYLLLYLLTQSLEIEINEKNKNEKKSKKIYYEFSLLRIFSLVIQPWMSAYIRKTDGVYMYVFGLPHVLQKLNSKFQKKNVKPSNIHSISAYEVFIFQLNSCLAI
jgi:uncharacterized membrane protein SpoIIM required for sporulation